MAEITFFELAMFRNENVHVPFAACMYYSDLSNVLTICRDGLECQVSSSQI